MAKKNQKNPKRKKNSKTKGEKPKVVYDTNDVLLCKTFAGPEVSMRVLSKVDRLSGLKDDRDKGVRISGFWGCLTSKKDQLALINSCVPYSKKEKPSSCKSFVFDWHIIKVLKKGS